MLSLNSRIFHQRIKLFKIIKTLVELAQLNLEINNKIKRSLIQRFEA